MDGVDVVEDEASALRVAREEHTAHRVAVQWVIFRVTVQQSADLAQDVPDESVLGQWGRLRRQAAGGRWKLRLRAGLARRQGVFE